jgi:hypothetical protein
LSPLLRILKSRVTLSARRPALLIVGFPDWPSPCR